MIKKCLLSASLILLVMAIATIANAGPNASDKRYWPSEARVESPASAYAMERRGSASQAAPVAIGGSYRFPVSKPQYLGGPKSGLTR